jgi:hypothetical protein
MSSEASLPFKLFTFPSSIFSLSRLILSDLRLWLTPIVDIGVSNSQNASLLDGRGALAVRE